MCSRQRNPPVSLLRSLCSQGRAVTVAAYLRQQSIHGYGGPIRPPGGPTWRNRFMRPCALRLPGRSSVEISSPHRSLFSPPVGSFPETSGSKRREKQGSIQSRIARTHPKELCKEPRKWRGEKIYTKDTTPELPLH
ncbi:hypothetical protein HJG60_009228 [Phyllostomus discolor]|uniref:Uncharacterized protein n=1 Tax=Phyllostomus discolor TaxID=89673 RepID=A0A833YSJ3_9CHIR|nr:hypothetical protein HJG60_009228 [Phyllostomus discolor]